MALRHRLLLLLVLSVAACTPRNAAPAAESHTATSTPPPPAWSTPAAPLTLAEAPRIAQLGRLDVTSSLPSTIFTTAIANDSSRLVGLNNEQIIVWDLLSGAVLMTTTRQAATQVYFSPDASAVYTLDESGRLLVIDARSGQDKADIPAHPLFSGAAAYAPKAGVLALGGEDGSLKLWDVAGQKALATFQASDAAIRALTFSADETRLATTGTDGRVRVWDWQTQTVLATLDGVGERLTFNADASRLAVAGAGRVRVWDWAAAQLDYTLNSGGAEVLAFAPFSLYLLTSGASGLEVAEASDGRGLQTLPISGQFVSAAFSPDGSLLVTTAFAGGVTLWDPSQWHGADIRRAELAAGSSILSAAWTPDSRLLLLVDAYGSIQVWGVR